MDFVKIIERSKRSELEVYPDFQTGDVEDILGRGKSFYAIWDEEKGLWSTNENDVQRLVDKEIWDYVEELKQRRDYNGYLNVKTLKSNASGMWNQFTQYMKRFPDSGIQLDEKLTFANTEVKKKDHVSKRLPYALAEGDYSAWDTLVGKLYSKGEREKIEWAIGSIVSGDSKKIQKFCVFYGEAGSGKSTIINIIQKLFDGYYVTFDAKSLGMSSNQFATEAFRTNPLVAIQHDGDLSRIEDNTRINSIVSHEMMTIKEKFKPEYMSRANCFIFMGTNRPVKITDAKSGIIRRLIDINPTGQRFSSREYDRLMSQIDFELGAIAWHCLQVYRELGKNYYKNYIPQEMIIKTDVFFNFVDASSDVFVDQTDGISLKQAYAMYKEYCEDSFMEFKLEPPVLKKEEKPLPLVLDCTVSLLDELLADCPAQYAKEDGSPCYVWGDVTTVLRDLDTSRVHYVQMQKYDRQLICVDFDIRNSEGEKDMLLNLEAASKWPSTYTEFSKGGCGVHLYYIYDGDVSKLSAVFGEGIEIKVFRGRAALRRRVSKCNDIPVAHLAEGTLPLKEEKMIDVYKLKDQDHLINAIKKSLRKGDNVGGTKCEIDLINKNLNEAYSSGMYYDVSDMAHDILSFGMRSTNNSDYCVRVVNQMKFKCKEAEEAEKKETLSFMIKDRHDLPITLFDIEIYPPGIDSDGNDNPGLFLICWKEEGEGKPVFHLINPKPHEVEELLKLNLFGYNNRDYDNHILEAARRGYNNWRLYDLSRRIIVEKAKDAKFAEAYKLSGGDVRDIITNKQSLKKHEIDLGISHIEMGITWDKPAPMSMWPQIIEYCENDVRATEAVLNAYRGDFTARKILADLAGGSINDTTNQLTTKIIFGSNRHPKLVYTDLATGVSY